jgi:hypothetical protein
MIRTTIAHTAAYLKTFFFEGDDALLNNNNDPGVVVYGDSDSYFNKRKDDRLTFPGLVFTLTQISQRNGPSKPTRFQMIDNAGGTKSLVLNMRPIIMTFSCTLYCQDELSSFDLLSRYYALQNNCTFPVQFYINDSDDIELDCSLTSFEDPTLPPSGTKSQSYEETGLIYMYEAGFSVDSYLIYSTEGKLIRCIKNNEFDIRTNANFNYTQITK